MCVFEIMTVVKWLSISRVVWRTFVLFGLSITAIQNFFIHGTYILILVLREENDERVVLLS